MRERLDLPDEWDGSIWHYRNLGRTHAMHHHAELEFNLVTQGTGHYLLANRKYQIRRGDLLWLFPAQEHVLVEQTVDFEMWIGVFKAGVVRKVSADPGARVLAEPDPAGEFCRRLSHSAAGRLEALCAEIAAAPGRVGLLNAGLAYLLFKTWQEFETAADVALSDVHPAVEKAARLIRDEPVRLSVEELARRAGLSAMRLSRLFKQQTGVALVDFRNRQRIERFLKLYGTGQRLTMLEAALAAGFGSYPQFHRVFKRVIGCSPGDYRRK